MPELVRKGVVSIPGSFGTREFFHGKSALLLSRLKWLFIALAFVLPAAMLAMLAILEVGSAAWSPLWFALAFALQYAGLLAERWFFFAQANHPQNLYYQAIA